ncbi:MAG: LamG domain-containing protein [Betaproteobacteria bacterium]|nr:MAG: LamG domain-containing protein [Betaproteobacteria bacterium]
MSAFAALLWSVETFGQVSFVASDTDRGNTAAITLTVPGSASNGDLLVTVISLRGGASQTINTPAGWNFERRENNGNNLAQAVYWRVVQAGDAGSNFTWNGWSQNRVVSAMLVYTGVDTISGSPIDVSGGQVSNGNQINAPSVTTGTATPLLLLAFGQAAGNRTITSPGGTTVRINNYETGSTSNGVTMELVDVQFAGPGATPAYIATSNRNDNNVGQTIAIKPGSAGPGSGFAFYRMEEIAWSGAAGEVTDSSGSGRHGTAVGSAQTTYLGRVCRGALIPLNTNFGQQDAIDTGFDINDVGNRGTISFWYQAAADWNSGAPRQLFDATASVPGPDPFFFAAIQGNGVLRFGLKDVIDGDYFVDTPAQTFTTGTWVHVAFSWQLASAPDNRLRTYINGTLAAEAPASPQDLAAGLGNLVIGDSSSNSFASGSTPNSANGVIDEFHVYDFEQTAAEIQTDLNVPNPCGLRAEYRLDELSWNGTPGEVLDSSPNGLNGTAIGAATPVPAQVCNGAQLNIPPAPLTDYIEVVDDPLLDITEALTVTAWVNPSVYPSSGLMTILSKDTNYEFHLTSTGQVNWWWNTGAAQLTTGAGAVPLNTWTHIAITFALGQQTIYINGVASATGTDAAALFNNNLPLQIGEDQLFGGGSRRFRGLIDEVQIHEATMSAIDVMTIMNATRPCLSAVDHYYVQHAASGVNCAAENITITAHDINHVAANAESRIITITAARVAGAAGNHGDFAIVAGTGTLNNGVADDGVATYAFGTSEVQVVLAYKNTWVQTVNMDVTDGTATDISGTASADAGYNQDLSFVPSGFRFVDAGNNTIPNQVAGVTDGPFYLQAIQTGAGGCTTPGPCTGVCTVPSAFGNGASVDVDLAFTCDNPTTCQAGQQVSIINSGSTVIAANPATGPTAWTTKSLLFGANGQAAFDMVYPDVGAISLHAQYDIPLQGGGSSSNLMTGQSNSLVVTPFDFVIASTAPNEIKRTSDGFVNPGATTAADVPYFIRAGDDFTVTVTAVNQVGNATPNYGQEISAEGVLLTPNLVAGLGLTNNPALTNPSAFGAFSNGTATGTTFSWGEVGIITLTPSVADSNYLGSGDVTGSPSGNVGRFVPFDFAVTRNAPVFDSGCSVAGKDAFTYIGEPFVYQTAPVIAVTARNKAGGTTQNYSGDFFRLNSGSLSGKSYTAATGSLDLAGLPGIDPAIRYNGDGIAAPPPPPAGTGTLSFSAGTGLKFTRATPIGAFDADIVLAINVIDADSTTVAQIDGVAAVNPVQFGQATAGNGILFSGTTVTAGKTPKEMRFGRLRMFNASGTSRLALPLRVQAEFYTANGFVANGDDSCTSFSGSDNAFAFVPSTNLVACETAVAPSGAVTLTDGQAAGLQLAAPGIGNDGSVDLQINLNAAAGNTCTTVGGASAPATSSVLDFLQGNWGGSAIWDQDPTARATFGIYNNAAEFLYLQENY